MSPSVTYFWRIRASDWSAKFDGPSWNVGYCVPNCLFQASTPTSLTIGQPYTFNANVSVSETPDLRGKIDRNPNLPGCNPTLDEGVFGCTGIALPGWNCNYLDYTCLGGVSSGTVSRTWTPNASDFNNASGHSVYCRAWNVSQNSRECRGGNYKDISPTNTNVSNCTGTDGLGGNTQLWAKVIGVQVKIEAFDDTDGNGVKGNGEADLSGTAVPTLGFSQSYKSTGNPNLTPTSATTSLQTFSNVYPGRSDVAGEAALVTLTSQCFRK